VGVEYLVLWLRVETQTTLIDEGCGMNFFQEIMSKWAETTTKKPAPFFLVLFGFQWTSKIMWCGSVGLAYCTILLSKINLPYKSVNNAFLSEQICHTNQPKFSLRTNLPYSNLYFHKSEVTHASFPEVPDD
jgi:hypothetical protein